MGMKFRSPEEQRTNRLKNTSRNVIAGFISTILATVIPFVMRTLIKTHLGSDFLGLNNLFLSIINLLSSAELGIGTVIVFFLYSPVAQNDKSLIEATVNELKKLYQLIGLAFLTVGFILVPFLQIIIKSGNPVGNNIYLLFLCILLSNSLQFFLFPELVSLSNAYQQNSINSLIAIISQVIAYGIQFCSVLIFKSYYLYVFSLFIQCVSVVILRKFMLNIYFSDIHAQGILSKDMKKGIKKRVLSMVGHQLDEKIFSSIDDLFLSSFYGLSIVATYGNYYYVIVALTMVSTIFLNSSMASLGNAIVTEDAKNNYCRFKKILFLNSAFSCWTTACLLYLYQDFIYLWMGELKFENTMVYLFCIYYYLSQVRRPVQLFKNAAGMWYHDRFRPYIAIIIDLILDIVLIPRIGYSGAIISSIVCLIAITIPWESMVMFKYYFHKSIKEYILLLSINMIKDVFTVILSVYACNRIIVTSTTIISFVLKAFLCSIISIMLFFIVNISNTELRKWIHLLGVYIK
jgi:O-antigen/teichoic acid export membrane protein